MLELTPVTNLSPLPGPPGGSLPATVVQHAAGPIGSWCGPETKALLQKCHQRRRTAAALDPILCGGTVFQYGAAERSQGHQRQKSEYENVFNMIYYLFKKKMSATVSSG